MAKRKRGSRETGKGWQTKGAPSKANVLGKILKVGAVAYVGYSAYKSQQAQAAALGPVPSGQVPNTPGPTQTPLNTTASVPAPNTQGQTASIPGVPGGGIPNITF